MSEATIFAALRLPSGVLSSLESGNITAIHAQSRNRLNQDFALCSDDSESNEVKISVWARCEGSQQFSEKDKCEILATHLQIPIESLQNALEQNGFIWLSYLRVYYLPSPIVIKNSTKGVFLALENRIYINKLQPVLDDSNYEKRKREVENLEPPEPLDVQIQKMLEEVELQRKMESLKKLDWIKKITTLGNRSIETDTGKNNWQAGTDFENIAKQGLEFLGFTIDESHKGGAGGLDLFCSKPYPLTGECKAGKSVPSRTTEELLKLGGMRLGIDKFLESKKLIIGAGKINNDVITASHEWKVSIIKAMTLQKLVELKAKYDGAINLFELKEHLQAGQIDDKIHEYIQKVESEIKLRSYIVKTVKELQDTDSEYPSPIEIRTHYNAKKQGSNLSLDFTKEILIELSSPLAGYLGRVKGDGEKGDRFYYLRDLPL
jgi:hypothetical protein